MIEDKGPPARWFFVFKRVFSLEVIMLKKKLENDYVLSYNDFTEAKHSLTNGC